MINIKIIIMAGGQGQRLWPLSRQAQPKQVAPLPLPQSIQASPTEKAASFLLQTSTLLEHTLQRVEGITEMKNLFISIQKSQVPLILGQKAVMHKVREENFIAEPIGKDTAAAILLATCTLEAKNLLKDDPVLFFTPADHYIAQSKAFRTVVDHAAGVAAATDALTLIGIPPTRPATEYGYLHTEPLAQMSVDAKGLASLPPNLKNKILSVSAFHEKPKIDQAQAYLDNQNFLWNAGMFFIKSSALIDAYAIHAADHLRIIRETIHLLNSGKNHAAETAFANLQNISFDYAIAEKLKNILCLPWTLGWEDLGSFQAIERIHHSATQKTSLTHENKKNDTGVISETIHPFEVQNVFAYQTPQSPQTIVLNGIKDLSVVVTEDIIYIADKKTGLPTKDLLNLLEDQNPDLL